jgi:hypothetical protein
MAQIEGSFVLARDINDDEIVHMSDIRNRALALIDSTHPKITATFRSMRSPADDVVHLSIPLSSDDEDDDNIQRPQTTTGTLFPDDEDDDNIQRPQTNTGTLFPDDLYESDLDSDDENERPHKRTTKSLYLSNCKKYGVLPSSTLMNIIETSSSSVVIRFSAMKPLDVKVMVLSLKMSTTVTKLDLGGNGFGSKGAIYLAKFIENSESILELNLSDNDIGKTGSVSRKGLFSTSMFISLKKLFSTVRI